MNIIKVLKWTGRVVAILAAVMAIMIAFAGGWGDAFYALFLAGVVWFWTDYLVARMARSREERAARQSRPPSEG